MTRQNTSRRLAAAGAALGGFVVFGLAPVATAPPAHADLFDFDWLSDVFGSTVADSTSALDPADTFNWGDLASWFDPSAGADLPGAAGAVTPDFTSALDHAGDGGAGSLAAVDPAPALAAGDDSGTSTSVTSVPLAITATTEPVVDISVSGGPSVPVVLDTGSNGLVIPWYDVPLQDLFSPTDFGFGAYSGGMGYFYMQIPETVSFGDGITTTGAVPIDVVLFSWPTNLQHIFDGWSLPTFLGPADAHGVLGIAPDAIGPEAPGTQTVIQALPDGLNQGVLIDEPGKQLVFGPSPLTGGHEVAGVARSTLGVSLDGASPTNVSTIIDSGGVFGTLPSSLIPGSQAGDVVASGVPISVYDQDGNLLYEYTAGASTPNGTDTPVITSGSTMNTGYQPFSQMPVYIGYGPPGTGTTTFYPGS